MIRFRLAIAAGLLLAAGTAHAQFPSSYAGASVIPYNQHLFGAYVPITDGSVGALAHLRLSFMSGVDFGFQGGLIRLDREARSRTLVRLGTDVKFLVAPAAEGRPIDIALGGGLGVLSGDDYNVLSVGPNVVVSRSWNKGLAGELTPYGSVGLAITTINVGPLDDNDFGVPVRGGLEVGISPAARLVFELQKQFGSDFNDEIEFTLGANLPF